MIAGVTPLVSLIASHPQSALEAIAKAAAAVLLLVTLSVWDGGALLPRR
jgi:hypothetical protein